MHAVTFRTSGLSTNVSRFILFQHHVYTSIVVDVHAPPIKLGYRQVIMCHGYNHLSDCNVNESEYPFC